MKIQVGELVGYRLWFSSPKGLCSICAGGWDRVGRWSPWSPVDLWLWPTEPTPALDGYTGAPAPTADGRDGYAAMRAHPHDGGGNFRLGGYFGDVCGRVEMWGTVVEGPNGFRAEYMAPTHLVEPHGNWTVSGEREKNMDAFLAFAAAWGAAICTLEQLP